MMKAGRMVMMPWLILDFIRSQSIIKTKGLKDRIIES